MTSGAGLLSSLTARVVFLPSLAYNLLMNRFGNRRWYDPIDENVILGALPLRTTARELIDKEGVTAVVSLNEDYELRYLTHDVAEWARLGVANVRFAVTDVFEAPPQPVLDAGVDFIRRHVDQGGRVYVHCKAGRSRSATMVGCYLMSRHGCTPEQAVDRMKAVRPHIIIHESKMRALEEFHRRRVAESSGHS